MDITDIHPLIEDLSSNIDELEESLQPLLKPALSTNASKLPLLDQAKLYVLATYALESLLFSSLRVAGVNAKEHPVFQELARVKQYFAKIKAAETAGTKRGTTLDKDAAGRFIKHALAGNEQYDRERSERIAKEKAGAKRKMEDMRVETIPTSHKATKRIRKSEMGGRAGGNSSEQATHGSTDSDGSVQGGEDSSMSEPVTKKGKDKSKHQRRHDREQKSRSELEGGVSLPALEADQQSDDYGADASTAEPTSDTLPRSLIKDMDAQRQQGSTDTSESKRQRRRNKKRKNKSVD